MLNLVHGYIMKPSNIRKSSLTPVSKSSAKLNVCFYETGTILKYKSPHHQPSAPSKCHLLFLLNNGCIIIGIMFLKLFQKFSLLGSPSLLQQKLSKTNVKSILVVVQLGGTFTECPSCFIRNTTRPRTGASRWWRLNHL